MTKDKGIFIKNIYYMLAYAFQGLNHPIYDEIAVEAFEDIQNLFAAILAKGIGFQLKQGLYQDYVLCREEMPVVRGKINMQGSIRNRIAHRRELSCEYDTLSENTIYNQILKTTIVYLLKYAEIDIRYQKELRRELFYFSKIDVVELLHLKWDSIHFQRNNQSYQLLIGICRLIAEGMLLTTDTGEYKLATFLDEQRMCHLYEKFLLNYYTKKFPNLSVQASQIPWSLDNGDKGMLPVMQTDITLQKGNTVLIIDAKYYAHTTQVHYHTNTLHSANIYQIFAYVKNRAYQFGETPSTVSGMLLYAQTEEDSLPNEVHWIHGNQIEARTLNLNQEFSQIEAQLHQIVEKYFAFPLSEVRYVRDK